MIRNVLAAIAVALVVVSSSCVDCVAQAAVLRGRVVDEQGRPVAGAAIAFVAEDWTAAAVLQQPQARSGADGAFMLPTALVHAVPGARAIAIAAPGRATAKLRNGGDIYIAFARLAARGDDLGAVMLPAGTTRRGRVRTMSAEPLAGARIEAESAVQRLVPPGGTRSVRYASAGLSGADGAFEVAGVVEGGAAVTVRARGCFRMTRPFVVGGESLLFELQPSGEVRGRLLGADGSPVQGIALLKFASGALAEQRTEVDGTFKVGIELPGDFTVHGHAFTPAWDHTWAKARAPRSADAVVELRLPAAAPVRIAVRDAATGRPVAGAAVHVDWLPPMWSDQAPFGVAWSELPPRTDADGLVTVPGPVASRLHGLVVVQKPGYATRVERHLAAPGGDEPAELQLVPGARATGRVLDAAGVPVAGARVIALPAFDDVFAGLPFDPPFEAIADARGRYELVDAPAGTLRLVATATGRAATEPSDLEVAAGATAKVPDLRLGAGFQVQGTIGGRGLGAGWEVRAGDDRGAFDATVDPNPSPLFAATDRGAFTLASLRGDTRLQVAMPAAGYTRGRLVFDLARLRVAADVRQTFDLTKVLPGRLRVQLRVTGGAVPLHRFCAVLSGPILEDIAACRAFDEQGRVDLPVLPDWQALRIVDLATGAVVAHRPVRAPLTSATEIAVDLALAEVRVVVRGDARRLHPCRLCIACDLGVENPPPTPWNTELAAPLALDEGATEFTVFAPARPLNLALRSGHVLRPGPALAEVDCEPKLGAPTRVELELPGR